jgi:DNA-binding transcriptional ArsR family regulator
VDRERPAIDTVFQALSDPTRRGLYGALRAEPGMTTGQLADATPGMTRWGVMKHLTVLRNAGLVQTLHDGRRRRHYADVGPLSVVSQWLEDAGGA